MKNVFTFLLSLLVFTTMAQFDLTIGTDYELNIQRQNIASDAFFLQNAAYNSGLNTLEWETSHTSFGVRGFHFNYQSGIHFYAQNQSTTAGLTFIPTTRFFIGNDGRIGIGSDNTSPEDMLHLSGGNIIIDNATNPTVFTGTGLSELNRYLLVANATGLVTPAGTKMGGLLVSTDFNYDAPDKGNLVVEGKVSIGQTLASNPDNHTLLVNGTLNTSGVYVNNSLVVSSPWEAGTGKIHYDGQVGIGTTMTNNPNNYDLAVNGKIGTHDIHIENSSTTWPDYVFDPAYKLPDLEEVEEYVKANGHLKDIPDASQVEDDGYSVHQLNIALLKKVEELTLYVIQQQKAIEQLKEQSKD